MTSLYNSYSFSLSLRAPASYVYVSIIWINSVSLRIISFSVKPTSSILNKRETINKKGKNTTISVRGRHDPCVGIRAVPIGEAMLSCVLLDHFLMHRAQCGS